MSSREYLIYLNWPEKCFRANAADLAAFRALVPRGSVIRRVMTDAAFLRALPRATHVLTWHFKEAWFARAPNLRVLATPGAGRELVSVRAPANVRVHFGGFHGAIMAESVAGFVLAWARGFFLPEVRGPARRGWWPRAAISDRCRIVAGTKAVVVGYGRVGRAIGAKLEGLGVSVVGVTHRNVRNIRKLVRDADWLILALPSDTGTDDFLDAKLIAALPRWAVVVNVGRGNAVDERALVAALDSGRIAGAYLDVFKGEPTLNRGQAFILGTDPRRLPWNLVRMPHSSAFSADYIRLFFQELKDDGCL